MNYIQVKPNLLLLLSLSLFCLNLLLLGSSESGEREWRREERRKISTAAMTLITQINYLE
jgi:hypothetical protein